MVYQINVNQAKNKQFLQMVELMTDLGVIQSIASENAPDYAYETTLSDEELLEMIEASEKDFENGNTYTMEEVRKAIQKGKESGFVENFDSDELLASLHEKHGIE